MSTKSRILLSLIFLMAGSASMAQEQIERLFRSERQNAAIDVVQTSDNGYLFLSAARPVDSTRFEYYTVSKFDEKGNFAWSKDYDFEQKVIPDGSITLLEGDSFVISGVLDTSSVNKILLKASSQGDVAWTRGFGRDDMEMPTIIGDASVDPAYQGGFLLAGDVYAADATMQEVYLSQTDAAGNLVWGKSYARSEANVLNTTKVKMTQDSGAIVTGWTFDGTSRDVFVVKTDSLGNIEWSREYGEGNLDEQGSSIAPTPDGGYLIGASKVNPALPSHPGLLIKTDTFGNPQWVRNIDFLTSDTILVNNIIIANDGEAVVSGTLRGIISGDIFAFMLKIDMNGDITWKRRYKAATRQSPFANGLRESPMGGFIYLTSSDENDEQVGPYLIKTDENGQTICDSIIDGQLAFPTMVTIDTLLLLTSDLSDARDVTVVDTLNYNGFNLVTLELETFGPYCPDEIFSDTLDATTDGAIAYEWSTGETTPTIVVTETDEYMVTVTIGVDYCYQLCANTTIDELPLPTVALDFSQGNYCSTGIGTVNASPTDSDNIDWSTGEMQVNSIDVDTEQAYSVTVSNTCGSDSAIINVVFDPSPPEVTINPSNTFCATGQEELSVTTSYEVDGYLWSTGEETPDITVNALGNYFITTSSNFCEDGSANIDVSPTQITVEILRDDTFCEDGEEELTANVSSPATSYTWSTGAIEPTITVIVQGPYSVTVSDFCGTDSTSLDILCPIVYQIPNIFSPNGDNLSEEFIPLFAFDPSELIEYEFIVYSRWGEKVFETNNPFEGWDGTVNDNPGASDVYIYTVKGVNDLGVELTNEDMDKDNHGDVTLIR